jgi:uncharacterized protein (TIGR02284 family)
MTDKTIGTINHLIAVCRDGEEFYNRAADKTDNARLQTVFREAASLHKDIGAELQPFVKSAGGSPAEGGTLAGKARQVVGTLKATFTSDKDQTLVSELEDAEAAAIAAFENALNEPIQEEAREFVRTKLAELKGTRERIRSLQEVVAAS